MNLKGWFDLDILGKNKIKYFGQYTPFEDLNNKVVNINCIMHRSKSPLGILLEYF